MRRDISFTFLIFATYFACKSTTIKGSNERHPLNDTIVGIELSHTFPQLTVGGKVTGYDTPRINIFFYKGMEMYQLPYNFFNNDTTVQKKTFYLIWREGKKLGLEYYLGDSLIKPFQIDSVIKKQWPYFQGEDIFEEIRQHGSLVSRVKSGNSEKLLYAFNWLKGIIPMKGIIMLTYSADLKDINFTFSSKLDTIPGMKLFMIKGKNEAKYLKDYNITFDEVNTYTKFEINRNFNHQKILMLFKKFEADSKIYLIEDGKAVMRK